MNKNKKPVFETRKTKIVATLGPNSNNVATLVEMLKAGMNVARINFSHGDHVSHSEAIETLKEAAKQANIPVAILQDLGGPKIRIGNFSTDTVTLVRGQTFTLTTKVITGNKDIVSINYRRLPQEVKAGAYILINDGKLQIKVVKTTDTDVICKVEIGGIIRGRRGVNVPGAMLSISAITPKDKKDLVFGLSKGVNFVTLSFVRKASEVHQLRKLLGIHQNSVGIISKIETKEAIDNLDEIISASDGVMIARGDLAVEIPRAEVPLIQKEIILKCNQQGKPVITATQMLDSMREQPIPTRAEVNDVANAILDGTDAVMLSDETTIGKYPIESVKMMAQISSSVESSKYGQNLNRQINFEINSVEDAVTAAIAKEAGEVNAVAIVALSESGHTGRLVARHRPKMPILVLTPHKKTYYQSLLVYGCVPVLVAPVKSAMEAISLAKKTIVDYGVGKKGDNFVLGAGMHFGKSGATNMLIIEKL